MATQPVRKSDSQGHPEKKKRGGLGCLLFVILVVLALVWRCIPENVSTWEATVPPAPPPPAQTPPWPTDMPRPPQVPTYDVGYLRWSGTLQPGQVAIWGGVALPANTEVPVGGATGTQPPCSLYGNVKVLGGTALPFVIFDEANFRSWREGRKATARAMLSVSTEQSYAMAITPEPQYLVLDNRKGTAEVLVGLTGIQSCLRSLQPGEAPFQVQPRPTATWRLREETYTLFGYLLHLLGASEETQVMTPPEIH